MSKFIVIFSTASSEEEAARIAKALVKKRLVACVNIIPKIRSIYTWKDKLCDEAEAMLVMKTQEKKVGGVKKELKSLHSYECPELIVLPISCGLPSYLKWISALTD